MDPSLNKGKEVWLTLALHCQVVTLTNHGLMHVEGGGRRRPPSVLRRPLALHEEAG